MLDTLKHFYKFRDNYRIFKNLQLGGGTVPCDGVGPPTTPTPIGATTLKDSSNFFQLVNEVLFRTQL